MKNLMGAITVGSLVVGGSVVAMTQEANACEYPEAKVTASVLNIRGGHGTQYPVIGKLKQGSVVSILEMKPENGFIKVAKGSTVGYVSVNYLRMLDTDINHIEEWVNKENNWEEKQDVVIVECKICVKKIRQNMDGNNVDTCAECIKKYEEKEDLSNKELLVDYKARTTANVNFRKSKEIRNDNKIQVIRKYSEVQVVSTSYDGKWAKVVYLGKEGYVSTQYIKAVK